MRETNAIVMRERPRPSSCLQTVWRRHGALLTLLAAITWVLSGMAIDRPGEAAHLSLDLARELLLVFPLMAALQAAGSVAAERAARTLETLRLTRLTSAELVDGWARLAWIPAVQNALLTGLTMLALTAWFLDVATIRNCPWLPSLEPLLLAVATSVAGCLAAAYVGLAISAWSASPGPAQGVSLVLFLLLVWLPVLGWPSLLFLLALAALGCRVARQALR